MCAEVWCVVRCGVRRGVGVVILCVVYTGEEESWRDKIW